MVILSFFFLFFFFWLLFKIKYHGLVSLRVEEDTSSANANKKAEVLVINQGELKSNVVSSRKTEVPQADKAELTSVLHSSHQVWNPLVS